LADWDGQYNHPAYCRQEQDQYTAIGTAQAILSWARKLLLNGFVYNQMSFNMFLTELKTETRSIIGEIDYNFLLFDDLVYPHNTMELRVYVRTILHRMVLIGGEHLISLHANNGYFIRNNLLEFLQPLSMEDVDTIQDLVYPVFREACSAIYSIE
jgi:hypothetical protein